MTDTLKDLLRLFEHSDGLNYRCVYKNREQYLKRIATIRETIDPFLREHLMEIDWNQLDKNQLFLYLHDVIHQAKEDNDFSVDGLFQVILSNLEVSDENKEILERLHPFDGRNILHEVLNRVMFTSSTLICLLDKHQVDVSKPRTFAFEFEVKQSCLYVGIKGYLKYFASMTKWNKVQFIEKLNVLLSCIEQKDGEQMKSVHDLVLQNAEQIAMRYEGIQQIKKRLLMGV